jgi:hypothetical protein
MADKLKEVVMGTKRMGVVLWCVTAICAVVYMAKPDTGEIPVSVIVTAMTLIAAMGGVDRWKQAAKGGD